MSSAIVDPKGAKRQAVSESALKLDTIVFDRMAEISSAQTPFTKALAVGRAYLDIRTELQSQMDFVVALAGQANGFKCDKPYPPEVVKQCAIDAIIAGCSLTGNEFNIIGGNFYIAQNGWKSKLLKTPGFSFANPPRFKAPVAGAGFVEVECEQDYIWYGEPATFGMKAFVRTNGGSNIDNNLGKAKAKLWHALFEKLSGEAWADASDVDTSELRAGSATKQLSINAVTSTEDAEFVKDDGEVVTTAKLKAKTGEKDQLLTLIDEFEAEGGSLTDFEGKHDTTMPDVEKSTGNSRSKWISKFTAELREMRKPAGGSLMGNGNTNPMPD